MNVAKTNAQQKVSEYLATCGEYFRWGKKKICLKCSISHHVHSEHTCYLTITLSLAWPCSCYNSVHFWWLSSCWKGGDVNRGVVVLGERTIGSGPPLSNSKCRKCHFRRLRFFFLLHRVACPWIPLKAYTCIHCHGPIQMGLSKIYFYQNLFVFLLFTDREKFAWEVQ
jgi:hypothetical protein